MNYQKKIKFVDKAIEMTIEGISRNDVENYLKDEGLKEWDIKKVNHSIDKHFKQKYKSEIRSYMLNNSLESKLSEFDDLDADFFEQIQYEIIAEIESESRRKVRSMIASGKSEEEIVKLATNSFFDEAAVFEAIDLESQKTTEKRKEKNKGIGFIILGVVLSIASIDLIPGGIVFFHGFVIYGIIIIYKAR